MQKTKLKQNKNEKYEKKPKQKKIKCKKRKKNKWCYVTVIFLINKWSWSVSSIHYCTGIDPTRPDHADYLNHINDDFEQKMTKMIGSAINKRENARTQEPLLQECLQHLEFCQRKSQAFGRGDDLQVEGQRCLNSWISVVVIIEKNNVDPTCLNNYFMF